MENQKELISPLQLTGRLEAYLTCEFINFAYRKSDRRLLGFTNLGNKGEERIDVALLKLDGNDSEEIVCLIEAKYLRNTHRINPKDDARDEIRRELKEFKRQVHPFKSPSHGGREVHLGSDDEIYGMVFASYVKSVDLEDNSQDFYNKILEVAMEFGFRSHNLDRPHLDVVYENVNILALGRSFRSSLKTGLWTTKEM